MRSVLEREELREEVLNHYSHYCGRARAKAAQPMLNVDSTKTKKTFLFRLQSELVARKEILGNSPVSIKDFDKLVYVSLVLSIAKKRLNIFVIEMMTFKCLSENQVQVHY